MHSSPTSQHIPRRRPAPAPAQRRSLPEYFRSPTQPRRTPASCAMHSPPTPQSIPHRRPSPVPAATHPSRTLPLPHAAQTHTRRLRDARPQAARYMPADRTTHFPPKTSPRPRTAHALPEHFRSPTQPDARPQAVRCIPRRRPSLAPSIFSRPSRALPLPHATPTHAHAAPTHARRLRNAFPAALTTHSPQRHAASPSVPLRAQKNGTAQCMCDAECFGRPSLRSVIWVGEPRAVRRRCGALACRRGA